MFSKLRAVYGKWAWLAGRRLAVDGGRSQHYCGGLDCGLRTQNVIEIVLIPYYQP